RPRSGLRRLPPLHHRLPLRDRLHPAENRQGIQVQPVRRTARLRHRLPHRGHRVERRHPRRLARSLGREGRSALSRIGRRHTGGRSGRASLMGGWTGKLLRVNLTNGTSRVEDIPADWLRDYIGGRGVADRYLFEEMDPTVDAFSPENKLIFATGPLTG